MEGNSENTEGKKNTGLGNRIKKEEKKRKERKSERTDNDVESFFFFLGRKEEFVWREIII